MSDESDNFGLGEKKGIHMKKFIGMALTILIVFIVLYILLPGFTKVSDGFIGEYAVSEDGKEMTIQVGVASSIGYIRNVSASQQYNGILYLDCYSAFGGLNGSIGANGKYTIQIEEETNVIALYRKHNAYEIILEKNSDGNWERVEFGNYIEKEN